MSDCFEEIRKKKEEQDAKLFEDFKRLVQENAIPDRMVRKCHTCEDDPYGLVLVDQETSLGYTAKVAVPCPDCNQWMKEHGYRTNVKTSSGLHQGIVSEKLLGYLKRHDQITEEIYRLGVNTPRSIYLYGPTGTGKTTITLKWANDILRRTRRPESVIYWPEKFLREALEDDPEYLFNRLKQGFQYLAIDDFGDEVNWSDRGNRSSTTARLFEAYDRLVDWLYDFGRYQQFTIVINSNRHPAEVYSDTQNGRAKRRRLATITKSEHLLTQNQKEQSDEVQRPHRSIQKRPAV